MKARIKIGEVDYVGDLSVYETIKGAFRRWSWTLYDIQPYKRTVMMKSFVNTEYHTREEALADAARHGITWEDEG